MIQILIATICMLGLTWGIANAQAATTNISSTASTYMIPNIKVLNTSDPNRFNCVKYARARVKNLPYGLWTLSDKKKIINSHSPKVGNIVIINTGFRGHVGIVTFVGKKQITIQEANYKHGKVTVRHGTKSGLKIVGYFRP